MDVLDARSVVALGNHELLPALDDVDAKITHLENLRLHIIARVEESGHAQELGARDAIELLALRHRRDRTEAWRDVRLARTLPKHATVTNALTHGIPIDGGIRPMRTAQAAAIVSELERVRSRVPVEDLDIVEQQLVPLAAHLAPKELRAAAKQLCNLIDTDGPEPEEQKAYDRETLTLTPADNGVKFKGYLANENAELIRSVIHAGARPHKTIDGQPDPRPRDKRQADALTTALTLATNAWDTNTATTPPAAAPEPTSKPGNGHDDGTGTGTGTGTGDGTGAGAGAGSAAGPGNGPGAGRDDGTGAGRDDGTGAGSDAGSGAGSGAGAGAAGSAACGRGRQVPGHGAKANITVTIDLEDLKAATATAIGQTVYTDNLSAATIRRLACDANIIPLVLGSNSEPLDVGRQERLVTKAIRRALNARDHGCVICGAPPVMCDAHHLISWIDGGETAINNLALLCRRDHVDIHHDRWHITITNGTVHVARPTWADPPPQPPHKPHDALPPAPAPPGDAPTRPAAPPGEQPARRDLAAAPPGDAPARPASPPADPWGGTGLPAASATGGRTSRWKADEATLANAARFAVWGRDTPAESDTGPPSFATI